MNEPLSSKLRRVVALSLSGVALSACASLGSVSVTQIPTDRSHPIAAESHDWTVFGLAGDNDYADEVPKQLSQQCPRGKITGLLTKSESKLWVFVSRRRVTARGFCVNEAAQPQALPAGSGVVPPLPAGGPPMSPPGVP